MTIFEWIQPSGKIWKVITDIEGKSVKMLNESSNVILLQENLSKAAIEMLEENFLEIVAIKEEPVFDSMYA